MMGLILKAGPEILNFFSYSTEQGFKFIMPVNVEMPTIVSILIFMSIINTTSEHLEARKVFIYKHLRFYEDLKFHAHLS